MDPVALVVASLAGGVGAGLKDSASAAVKDAYGALKSALADRFRGKPGAQIALTEHETTPEAWTAPLTQYVTEVGVDEELLRLAQRLQEAVQESGGPMVVQVNAETVQGQQIGTGNTQNNTFG